MMDLKQIMQELHFGAQHFAPDERRFFDNVWTIFQKNGGIAEAHAPHVLELYKKLKFRQLDVNGLIGELESNVLLLADDEHATLEGARMALELDGRLDNRTIEKLLILRKNFRERQHNTLVGRGESVQAAVPARVLPAPTAPARALPAPPRLPASPHPSNPAVMRRPSARRPGPLGPVAALEAASKLLKGR
jgi:hypothetical protein